MALDPIQELAIRLDPSLLMESLDLEPDPWQRKVLRSTATRMLLLCCRQAGKSTTTAALALHTALFEPGSLILLVSPSLRQSGELFRKLSGFYAALGRPVAPRQETALSLTLDNGSRVISLPASPDTIRGFSAPRLIVVDEAAMVEDGMFVAINPMLATSTNGRLVYLSTPFGKRGVFHEQWHDDGAAWERTKITATECPRITAEFLAEQRRTLGERWFAQEYMCSFEEAIGQVFSTEAIMSAFDTDVQPLF